MKPGSWRKWARWALLGATLAAAVAAVGFGDDGKGKTKPARERMEQPATAGVMVRKPQSEAVHVELERLNLQEAKKHVEAEIGNVFGAITWYVPPPPPPPPPPAKPVPPPKPTAPPLPFGYLGTYQDAAMRVVILVKGDRIYTVSEGDVIEGTYRVEQVAAGQIELTYLPLNIRQLISTGGTS